MKDSSIPAPKILLIRTDILTETLSGAPQPLHCRDIKARSGAYDALARWSKWGYTVLGLSDQSAIANEAKDIATVVEELSYTVYCFPALEAIYFDIGVSLGGICRTDGINYSCVDAVVSRSLLGNVLPSIFCRYSVQASDVLVASDLIDDENVASNYGASFFSGDVWRVCLDAPLASLEIF